MRTGRGNILALSERIFVCQQIRNQSDVSIQHLTPKEPPMPASPEPKQKLEAILGSAFPGETVDVSDGYADNVHIVVVVSKKFRGMHEKEKQELLWSAITAADLTDDEKVRISLIMPYSPDEPK